MIGSGYVVGMVLVMMLVMSGVAALRRRGELVGDRIDNEGLAHAALGTQRERQESTSLNSVARSSSATPGLSVKRYVPGAMTSETDRRCAWT